MNPIDAYDFAWRNARRNPDGTVVESDLVAMVAEQVDFNADEARLGLARRIVARRKRPGQTAAEGWLVIPGLDLEPHEYEPHRLVADDEGNLVENKAATVRFKLAEAARAEASAAKAAARATRERAESDQLEGWATERSKDGTNPAELVWETCVRETGLWKEADIQSDEDDLDGAA